LERVDESLPELEQFAGRLGEGPQVLLGALDAVQHVKQRAGRVLLFAGMRHKVDTGDPEAAGMFGRAQALWARVMAATSFLDPELLEMGEATWERWLQQLPVLSPYRHYVADLFRRKGHVRSPEVEKIMGMLSELFSGPETTAGVLANADFRFEPATTSEGDAMPVTQGTLDEILGCPDREARRTAWESYSDTYLGFRNTLAANLGNSIRQSVFAARVRRHGSSLSASLFEDNIPVEVFRHVVETFRVNLPLWHRYWKLRRDILQVETLHPYDTWAPLTPKPPRISYEEAVDWICNGLTAMGEDYGKTLRRGCLQDRWVDVYPNRGKAAGAFSWGVPGTHPFIVMNYANDIESLSTLAHELGHSMHSYLTWRHQPYLYGAYSIFLAEVASNFHQAMVRAYLLDRNEDASFQLAVLEEAMSNFHRYLFVMPTLARFELEAHRRIEQGKGLPVDDMMNLMADLFGEGYGSEVYLDRERVGITWATFGHLYRDYYVYQYVTGIAGAHALAQRVLSEEEGAVEETLRFLQAGASRYPLDVLREAGVDLTTPEPIQKAFDTLKGMIDRLERLAAIHREGFGGSPDDWRHRPETV
jgi:oligoendopeptidase F